MVGSALAVAGQWIGGTLLLTGTAFCILGIYGVLRLPDFYSRLHAAGMVMTLGAGGILLSLVFLGDTTAALKGIATAGFLALTAPLVTHVLARIAHGQDIGLGPEAGPDELRDDRESRRDEGP
jgi:multicomponent Na+:H+ antiporter subunit G